MPLAGDGHIKSTPNLGWHPEKRSASFTVDYDLAANDEVKRRLENHAMGQFIEEEARIDGAKFLARYPFQATWHPYLEYHEADIQRGENGATRPVARSVARDSANTGKWSCRLEAWFMAPDYIQEIPTKLANEIGLFEGRRPGLKPLRERRWGVG